MRVIVSGQSYTRPAIAPVPPLASFPLWLTIDECVVLTCCTVWMPIHFLSLNFETVKSFVKIMFEECKHEIQVLRNENNELRTENKVF